MKLRSTLVVAIVLILVMATSGAAMAAGHTGTVTAVHGIPSIPLVDVYVNNMLTLEDFAYGTVTAPLELPAGDYTIDIRVADADPMSMPALSIMATVTAGLNASVVAHLTEAGDPTISVFVNDVSPIMDDMARLVVRHTAAAPAVDVALYDDDDAEADDLVGVLGNLANPNEAMVEVPEDDDYVATISPAGGMTPVFGPVGLDLDDEMAYIVYAVGDLAGGSFTLLLQTIELEQIDTGTVTVVHGVPGLTVDVYVNGALTLPSFAPNTVTDPFEMPVGTYDIVIVPEGGDPATPAISGSATVTDDLNASVVAHLDAAGMPTLSVFANDVSDILDDTSRLVVRHTAAAPAVDIALLDASGAQVGVLQNLANPMEAQVEVPEGSYAATIAPAGSTTPVFGPVPLELEDEISYIVYAVGDLMGGSFTLLVQTIELDEADTGTVTVVHGVPGLTVDVYVNGALALPSFAPNTVTDPLEMPAGTYDIVIVPEGGDPATPAISGSATVTDDLNASVVAHLDAAGTPTLSVFANDASDILDDTARLVVRHTAAAPAVDIALLDASGAQVGVLQNLANPMEAQVEVPEGSYAATIAPAGSMTPVVGPVPLELEDETSYIVYAVGDLAGGTFTLLVQTIDLDEID